MPFEYRQDFDALMGYAIDDAVVPFQNFSDFIRFQFRKSATNERERRPAVAAFDELGNKKHGSVGRILGYKIFDLLNPFQRLFSPDEPHAAFLASRQAARRR